MEVRIQAIHFDATEKLQDFIQKKTAKLEKYCDDINKVEVSLKVVKPETAMNKEASMKVLVPNGEFFAEKVSDTFEESVVDMMLPGNYGGEALSDLISFMALLVSVASILAFSPMCAVLLRARAWIEGEPLLIIILAMRG